MSYSKAIRMSKENMDKVWDAEKKEWVNPPTKITYKAWFKIGDDPKWYTASKEWDTKEEATEHALFKYQNWMNAMDKALGLQGKWTVTKTGVDPNETKGE